jgi:hypothetical protein
MYKYGTLISISVAWFYKTVIDSIDKFLLSMIYDIIRFVSPGVWIPEKLSSYEKK